MLDHIALQLDRERIKGREDSERGEGGGGGAIIRLRRLFPVKYFRQRGAIIRGNMIISLSIRHFRNEKETGDEMSPAIVSGIVTGDAPFSY